MRDRFVWTLMAVMSITAVILRVPVAAAQDADAKFLWVSSFSIKTLQRNLQAAADRGYRLVPIPSSDFFDEKTLLVEKRTVPPEPVDYLILFEPGKVDEAAAKGYRYVGTPDNLFVMERRKENTTRTHDYVVLGTRLKNSMENELLASVEKGFRIVGLTTQPVVGIFRDTDRELVAILERSIQNAQPAGPQYLILYSLKAGTTQSELQKAANDGYRLSPFQAAWGSTVMLEKRVDAESMEYLVLSAGNTGTMQREMDKASAEGYRFASTFGSGLREFVVAMQRPRGARARTHEQVVLATSRFKTMERESLAQMANGFQVVGLTRLDSIRRTYFGRGPEGVAILERRLQ